MGGDVTRPGIAAIRPRAVMCTGLRLPDDRRQDRCLVRLGPGVRRKALLAAANPVGARPSSGGPWVAELGSWTVGVRRSPEGLISPAFDIGLARLRTAHPARSGPALTASMLISTRRSRCMLSR